MHDRLSVVKFHAKKQNFKINNLVILAAEKTTSLHFKTN